MTKYTQDQLKGLIPEDLLRQVNEEVEKGKTDFHPKDAYIRKAEIPEELMLGQRWSKENELLNTTQTSFTVPIKQSTIDEIVECLNDSRLNYADISKFIEAADEDPVEAISEIDKIDKLIKELKG